MGRQCEGAEVDCASEGGKKREEEEMGEEEHEEAEDESHEGNGGADGGDDDDCFFESLDRVPSGVSFDVDLISSPSDSDDEDDDDVRVSFASAIEAPRFSVCVADFDDCLCDDGEGSGGFDYGIWMAEPVSLAERRRRLLRGMGLTSRKDLAPSQTFRDCKSSSLRLASHRFPPPLPPSATPMPVASALSPPPMLSRTLLEPPLSRSFLVRSLSDPRLPYQAPATGRLFRSHSLPPSPWLIPGSGRKDEDFVEKANGEKGRRAAETESGDAGAGACKIKNLDTGKEFLMSDVGKDGSFGRLNDVQTGLQLTMDEFDRFLGFSPIVKELMRRVNLGGDKKKTGEGNSGSTRLGFGGKSSKSSGRKRRNWLKNIKFVASSVTGLISERELDNGAATPAGGGRKSSSLNGSSSEWLKVHRHGKSHKELTGLYMSQEVQAHQGSIWCMRFSSDGRYLASAGEDRIVHVWQVMEADPFSTFSTRRQASRLSTGVSGPTPAANGSASNHASILGAHASKGAKKESKLGSRRLSLPDYIVLPDTIFSISEAPTCSFEGHLDDVLDLSWSKSQHLLSSSMDKTVRLWDMKSKTCLKFFAHNDYVTCIQFNPIDDDYFISGSLDGKARIWSIPNRQVVDWSDLHEMVTAVCYTRDGQGALVGSHKGSFRFYKTSDDKISQESQIDISNKKRKSHAKKITGFQYAPDNPSEVLVTSADSQIRVFDGVSIIHKFRGFRNTSSQISASFSADGKYVVCASEDSNVYIWKREAARGGGGGGGKKGWGTTRSHEYFYCKDVSVAVPWPNIGSNCEKPTLPSPFSSNLGASTRSQPSSYEDPFPSGRSNRPLPLPPKKSPLEQILPPTSPDALQEPLLGNSSPPRSPHSSVNSSSSSFSSWGWGGGSSRVVAASPDSTNAWGLVVVTAGLGGNIRIYQNFGLPVRLSRQNSLF